MEEGWGGVWGERRAEEEGDEGERTGEEGRETTREGVDMLQWLLSGE